MIQLTRKPIDYHALTEAVRSNQSGAVVLFLGTVREMTEGRKTAALDYEAFPEMAEAKMQELIGAAQKKWPIDKVGIIHRLGHLELGDISVALAVSCPHRQQAFEAGKFLIDELKVLVPIWKKENWADGSTEWVHPGFGPEGEKGRRGEAEASNLIRKHNWSIHNHEVQQHAFRDKSGSHRNCAGRMAALVRKCGYGPRLASIDHDSLLDCSHFLDFLGRRLHPSLLWTRPQ